MIERSIAIERATPANIAPFGRFVGAAADLPVFAQWPGAVVYGQVPITVGRDGELLHVVLQPRELPVTVELLERHPHHTQAYLPANGKPFIMVMGDKSAGGLPDFAALRAFEFADATGIALHAGIWHEFPVALEPDTRFTVILRAAAHENRLEHPARPLDARGPDLERYDMAGRARLVVLR
jgi:ureidoglycolate lyase